jgi:hypothetical protein
MLTALHIANFKAFADQQKVPLRPLTLIYGQNSSGKSSILHSLVLARHALDTGELDAHRTAIGGESVDLGGFRQYIHRREPNRRMEWSVELDAASFTGRPAELFAPVRTVVSTTTIGIALDQHDLPVPQADPGIQAYEIRGDGKILMRMSRRRDGRLNLDRLNHEHPVFREVLKAIVETSTTTESIRVEDFEGLDEAIAEIVPEIVVKAGSLLPEGLDRPPEESGRDETAFFPISQGRRREDLAAAVRFFIPRIVDELIRGVRDLVVAEVRRLEYLGPLRSYPPRHVAFSEHHDPNWQAGGGHAWEILRRDERVRRRVNEWLQSPDRLQTPYALVLRQLIPDAVLEQVVPERLSQAWHDLLVEFLKTSAEWRADGESAAVMAEEAWREFEARTDPDQNLPLIEQWVSQLTDSDDTARQWLRAMSANRADPLQDLILVDQRSKTPVSHRDVGVGISQVLPVLVGAYASDRKIVAIEQPEIHLHPALQAELGDVFIESALGERRNRFILESHSEHLLLRIMRRMRETAAGTLPEGVPPVAPEDVMVLYVEPDGPRSIVREMPLNEKGELVKAWPGGFFEEGLREVF